MEKIHILASHHLEKDFSPRLGGLDVYLNDLAVLLANNGYCVYMHEKSPFGPFNVDINGYKDCGYYFRRPDTASWSSNRALIKRVVQSGFYSPGDLVIFGTDYLALGNYLPNSLAIQHGVAWDIPFEKPSFLKWIRLLLLTRRKVQILSSVSSMVCVDYNYPNWLRANYGLASLIKKVTVIPNYASIPPAVDLQSKTNSPLKIVFARRFWRPRGTLIAMDCVKALSKRDFFSNLLFYFAGSGEDEDLLKTELSCFPNVVFEKYESGKGLEYHADKDIALIPTFGSEGTSLSALEAMAAGCAVISTSVGGLSNILLSNYNGIIAKPSSQAFAAAIEDLYFNRDKLLFLRKNAKAVAEKAFSKEVWEKRWFAEIHQVLENGN